MVNGNGWIMHAALKSLAAKPHRAEVPVQAIFCHLIHFLDPVCGLHLSILLRLWCLLLRRFFFLVTVAVSSPQADLNFSSPNSQPLFFTLWLDFPPPPKDWTFPPFVKVERGGCYTPQPWTRESSSCDRNRAPHLCCRAKHSLSEFDPPFFYGFSCYNY